MALAKKNILGFSPFGYCGHKPFNQLFDGGLQDTTKHGFDGISAFLLSGGMDIHPGYYREQHHKYNQCPDEPTPRDVFEWKAIHYCRANKIPIIGICRGAQLLCAAAGGSLIQHVTGHGYGHNIVTKDGEVFESTSVHHQMMNPWSINHELLAWAEKARSKEYQNGNEEDVEEMHKHPEPEIVYFPDLKAIGIQGHPEYGHATQQFENYCLNIVKEYLL